MAEVILEGVFMACNPKTTNFEGNQKTALYFDVYQPNSSSNDKTVQIKSEDLELLNKVNKEYSMGSAFRCKAVVNAYKNKAYYRFIDFA